MPLTVTNTLEETRKILSEIRRQGLRVGFVPTMGALHAGHAALMRTAKAECDFVVVSIFVNPTQFGPKEDLAKYPRTWEQDCALCEAVGVGLIFAPTPEVMYPTGFRTFVEVGQLSEVLCGPKRPGHFRGVATVVLKLFNIVAPTVAYFGQKDAQQVRVIQQMTRDLDLPLTISVCPTVREADGLAMSSRNRYLDPTQRHHATALYRALEFAKNKVAKGERDVPRLRQELVQLLANTPGAVLDYVEILTDDALQPLEKLDRPALLALAVFFGTTRLIDNVTLSP